jgi:hypothetical protein
MLSTKPDALLKSRECSRLTRWNVLKWRVHKKTHRIYVAAVRTYRRNYWTHGRRRPNTLRFQGLYRIVAKRNLKKGSCYEIQQRGSYGTGKKKMSKDSPQSRKLQIVYVMQQMPTVLVQTYCGLFAQSKHCVASRDSRYWTAASQTSMFPRQLDTVMGSGVFYAVRAEML